jgi:spore germination protein GerM
MRRTTLLTTLTFLLVATLLAALLALGACRRDGGDATTDSVEQTADTTDEGEQAPNADAPQTPATTDDGSGAGVAPNAPTTLTVRLYWVEDGEHALGVERSIPYTQAVATASLNALIAGPTPEEQTAWPSISNAIPPGTRLLGVTVADGVAKVNLSKEFESGGGTFSVTARLAQVVYTLEQFPAVDAVEFYLEGVKVEMFSSEGLILIGPQTSDDYYDLLPVDA